MLLSDVGIGLLLKVASLGIVCFGKLNFKVVLRYKESSYCEKTCDTEDAKHVVYRTVVVNNNLSCNSNDKHLKSIGRGEVYEHSYELKSDDDIKYVLKKSRRIRQI